MRNPVLALLLIIALIGATGCAGYRTETGAAIGAGAGALAGQAIGRDTESTLIGAALGGITGAMVGHAMDTYDAQRGIPQYGRPTLDPTLGQVAYPSGNGYWVTVPGQWVNGGWVPPHQVWVPAGNPGR